VTDHKEDTAFHQFVTASLKMHKMHAPSIIGINRRRKKCISILGFKFRSSRV
jgi:hypothetical protein